jgi:GH18 family chitinase
MKSFRACAVLLVVALAACGGGTTGGGPAPTPTPVGLPDPLPAPAGFKVVGYSPSWTNGVYSVQWDKLTHVNYAFMDVNSSDTAAAVPNPAMLRGLVTDAHARGKSVFLSVGGFTNQDNHGFEGHGKDTASARAFAASMMDIVSQFALDGVDIDWEWPAPGGTDQMYANLMIELCATLHANGKQCSSAVVATNAPGIPSSTFDAVDWFNLMAYDMGTGPSHSPYSGAVAAFDYWSGRGLPAAKMVLGTPFYGRANNWTDERTWAQIVAADPTAPSKDDSNGYYYSGPATTQRKTDLAVQRGGGMMVWELSQDTTGDNSLLGAIHSRIR